MQGNKRGASLDRTGILRPKAYRRLLASLVAFLLCVLPAGSCFAEPAPLLKPDVPKLDNSTPEKTEQAERGQKGPLQGKVQHNEKAYNGSPILKSGAGRTGRYIPNLKGKASDGQLSAGARDDRLNAQAESGIGIIGVKFVMFMGRPPVINRVFPQTPAAQRGLLPNDVIVAVDGVPTLGLSKEEVYDMIVGTPGTDVTLSLRREGDYKVVTMTRMDLNDITDPFVRRDYMLSM